MNDEKLAELNQAFATFGECVAKAAEALAQAIVIVAYILPEMIDDLCDHYEVDNVQELQQAFERIQAPADMADLADDLDEIIPTKKLPRPPKRIGPVNKANYAANKPPRVARSSCRTNKH